MRLIVQPTDDMPGNLIVQRALQVLRDAWIQASGGATFVDENEKAICVVLLERDSDRYRAMAELEVAGIRVIAG